MSPDDTTAFLHAQIPITRAMGVRVLEDEATPGRLTLTAPLEANHNHLHTAFGGSLSALCTLAGYVVLWLELDQARPSGPPRLTDSATPPPSDVHVVVKESRISYLRPVTGAADGLIRVVGLPPEPPALESFHARFAEKGRARVDIHCFVEEDGQRCVEFHGTFVAMR